MRKKQKYEEFVPMFQMMEKVAGILREKRKKKEGSIDFDFSGDEDGSG